jgi:hypothetical protein
MLSEALDRTVQGEAKHLRSFTEKTTTETLLPRPRDQGDRPSHLSLSSVKQHQPIKARSASAARLMKARKNKKPWPGGHGFLKSIRARFLSRDGGKGMTG